MSLHYGSLERWGKSSIQRLSTVEGFTSSQRSPGMAPPATTWYHLVPPGTICHHLAPPGITWYNLEPSWTILDHLLSFTKNTQTYLQVGRIDIDIFMRMIIWSLLVVSPGDPRARLGGPASEVDDERNLRKGIKSRIAKYIKSCISEMWQRRWWRKTK